MLSEMREGERVEESIVQVRTGHDESPQEKPRDLRGFPTRERLKGLGPSTFCMANGMSSAVTCLFYLQIDVVSDLGAPRREIWIPAK